MAESEQGKSEGDEVLDAEVVEDPGTEVVGPTSAPAPVASHSNTEVATLWNTHDPSKIIERASTVANALKKVIDQQEMTTSMGAGRKHVNIEAWQTAGTLLGLQAIVVDVRRIEPRASFEVRSKRKKWGKVDGKRQITEETENAWTAEGWSYSATAEVRTMDGRIVSRAEASCTREESKWMESDDYAVKSMAQTRACSKALRQALGFIVGMAGYETTPSEEMPEEAPQGSEAVPYGDASKSVPKVKEAIAFLLGAPDNLENPKVKQRAEALTDKLTTDAGGYLPKIVGRALMFAAADLKASLEAEPAAEKAPSETDGVESDYPAEKPEESGKSDDDSIPF